MEKSNLRGGIAITILLFILLYLSSLGKGERDYNRSKINHKVIFPQSSDTLKCTDIKFGVSYNSCVNKRGEIEFNGTFKVIDIENDR